MREAPLFLTLDDHVVLGNRVRDCREVLMHLLVNATPGSALHRGARQSITALDRLRTDLDCHLQQNTPRARDPRRLVARVYADSKRFIACLATAEERCRDGFAGWEVDEE